MKKLLRHELRSQAVTTSVLSTASKSQSGYHSTTFLALNVHNLSYLLSGIHSLGGISLSEVVAEKKHYTASLHKGIALWYPSL